MSVVNPFSPPSASFPVMVFPTNCFRGSFEFIQSQEMKSLLAKVLSCCVYDKLKFQIYIIYIYVQ